MENCVLLRHASTPPASIIIWSFTQIQYLLFEESKKYVILYDKKDTVGIIVWRYTFKGDTWGLCHVIINNSLSIVFKDAFYAIISICYYFNYHLLKCSKFNFKSWYFYVHWLAGNIKLLHFQVHSKLEYVGLMKAQHNQVIMSHN